MGHEWLGEDYDENYDTGYAPSPGQLEAEQIRRECRRHAPVLPVTITADEYDAATNDAAKRHKER